MKIVPTLALVLALALPGAASAASFEGTVTMKVTANTSQPVPDFKISLKDGFMRVDMNTPMGSMAAVTDFKSHQLLLLMPAQQMYMVRPLPSYNDVATRAGAPTTPPDVKDTGEKETIAGYVCSKLIATNSQGTTTIWATDQLGTFGGLFNGGPGSRGAAPQAWETALKGRAFFPLRVVTNQNGKETFRLEVTSVEKQSLPDTDFAAPAGWHKFDLGAMMGGGFPGARPPEGNN